MLSRLLPLSLMLLASAPAAFATNGYFAHGYSVSQRALGGAGTALAEDALALTINPASAAWVEDRADVNLSLFKPVRNYETGDVGGGSTGFGILTVAPEQRYSGRELFGIPGMAWVERIDDTYSAGLAIYGNGGLNTVYKGGQASFARAFSSLPGAGALFGVAPTESRCQGTFGGGAPVAGNNDTLGFCGNGTDTTSVDLIQLLVTPTLSMKLNDGLSLGFSPIFAGQRFQAKGLQAFSRFSNSPDRVSDQGYSFSFGGGARIGLSARSDLLDFGASYQSRIRMSRFKEYEGLFADGGDFDIPSTWNLGIALKPAPGHTILFDYQRINFSEEASVGLPLNADRFVNECALPRLAGNAAPSAACLGSATGPGFGWQDIGVRKFGYQFRHGDWTWRAGYSHTRQPIPASEVLFNILAPGVIEQHYTLGAGWRATPSLGFDLALMYAPPNPVTGKNPLSNVSLNGTRIDARADAADQDIRLDMKQYEVTLGMNYRY